MYDGTGVAIGFSHAMEGVYRKNSFFHCFNCALNDQKDPGTADKRVKILQTLCPATTVLLFCRKIPELPSATAWFIFSAEVGAQFNATLRNGNISQCGK